MIVQNLSGRAGSDNPSALENMARVGNIFDQVKIVSCRDYGLPPAAATYQEVNHLAFTFGIKRGRGLVEQQDFRIQDQHRGQCDPLFFSRRQMMRRAIL